MLRRSLITTTEHHGEGILEFHVTNPAQCISAWEAAVLVGLFITFVCFRLILGCQLLGEPWWPWVCFLVGTGVFLLRKLGSLRQESLLVVHDLGLQVRRTYYSGRQDFTFVERSRIVDVIINEGVRYATVTYYLAIIIKGSNEMLLGFGQLIPPLPHLLVAYHGLRSVIFGDEWPDSYKPHDAPSPDQAAEASTATAHPVDHSRFTSDRGMYSMGGYLGGDDGVLHDPTMDESNQ